MASSMAPVMPCGSAERLQTYLAGLEYIAIYFIPIILIGIVIEKNESTSGFIGCLSMLFVPVLQVAALIVTVLTLSPIIFGISDDAAWTFPWRLITMAPTSFFKLVGILIVAAISLAFVPILGRLQSLQTLLLGGIALTFVLGIYESLNPGSVGDNVKLIPGIWFSIALLVIGGALSWAGMLVAAFIIASQKMIGEGIAQLIMFPFVAILGFIPVFIYGAWLGAQVAGGF